MSLMSHTVTFRVTIRVTVRASVRASIRIPVLVTAPASAHSPVQYIILMDNIQCLLQKFHSYPTLLERLSLGDILLFISHARLLKNDILLAQHATHNPKDPPSFLPPTIASFLGKLLNMPPEDVANFWMVMKELLWDEEWLAVVERDPDQAYRSFGLEKGLSTYS